MDDSNLDERLRLLAEQHRDGTLTDAEYAAAKRAALGGTPDGDFAQETLVLRAVDRSAPTVAGRHGSGLLVLAVGVVVLVLIAVVWLWPP